MEYIPFKPDLNGLFLTRFYKKVRQLIEILDNKKITDDQQDIVISDEAHDFIRVEIEWATDEIQINPSQRRIYRAIWLLLRDLISVRWKLHWNESTLQITPPQFDGSVSSTEELKSAKRAMRYAMSSSRNAKIAESKEFIERMEKPSSQGIPSDSIHKLIASSTALLAQLQPAIDATTDDEKMAILREGIQPYLQLVQTDERCEFTGHKLTDIWRYFRYTWSISAESTPGRTLRYLIRDAAQPFHPVIGISSLENAVIRSPDRDHHLGWSTRYVGMQLLEVQNDEHKIRAIFQRLLDNLDDSIHEIDWSELAAIEEINNPTNEIIHRIQGIANHAAEERKIAIKAWQKQKETGEGSLERSEFGNISKTAEDALYRSKRATRLYRWLGAKKRLSQMLCSDDFNTAWRKFVGDIAKDEKHLGTIQREQARGVIRTAIRAVKGKHIGTSILELNVCGAIPPYNEILGGKLVALLMLSPQVVADYRERYGNRPSDIASRMKGEDVIRPAEIVFIGTTSLYGVGSSQYNRLKLPANLLRSDAPMIRWEELGKTAGYGTMHISEQTLQSLQEATITDGERFVNNVFGEGASPKMRAVRQALNEILNLDQSNSSFELIQHTMSRIIYGAWIAINGREFLSGQASSPNYYFDETRSPIEQTAEIVDYWRYRWLRKRIHFDAAIRRIRDFNKQEILLGDRIKDIEQTTLLPIEVEVNTMSSTEKNNRDEWTNFVRDLYRGTSAYADKISPKLLKLLHVTTKLDKAIIDGIRQGYSVVLTGNPGDGKTHLLRILEPALAQLTSAPIVELDASAKTDDDLLEIWQGSIVQQRPLAIAINEAVLNNLSKRDNTEYEEAIAQIRVAQAQVENAIYYSDDIPNIDVENHKVIVFDLSRRNVLSEDVVLNVISILANPDKIGACQTEHDDLSLNIKLLGNDLVRQRIQEILNRVGQRGFHATVRQLQAFISFLIFGDRKCHQIILESADMRKAFPQLLYSGKGVLFDQIRDVFDPCQVTHPIWDEALVMGIYEDGKWVEEWEITHSENTALIPLKVDEFNARKRAFFFFNTKGSELLDVDVSTERDFAKFIDDTTKNDRNALRLIIERLNRFFGIYASRELRIWQSHRYDNSSRRILYSSLERSEREFELVFPRLLPSMKQGFDLAMDHIVLRSKHDPNIRLRIDYPMFDLLAQASQGIPIIVLENNLTRRIWQFMELLVDVDSNEDYESEIQIFDLTTGEKLDIRIDNESIQYVDIEDVK